MPGAGPIVGGVDPEDGGRADSLLGRFRAALTVRWWRLLGDRHAHLRPAVRLLRRSPLFDADWYRATYADVTAARIDPALHYAAYGHAEGRDPGPDFSTRAYLARYRDVARSGINALLHYLSLIHI